MCAIKITCNDSFFPGLFFSYFNRNPIYDFGVLFNDWLWRWRKKTLCDLPSYVVYTS